MSYLKKIFKVWKSGTEQQESFLNRPSRPDASIPKKDSVYRLSEDMSLAELEKTYYEVVLSQEFYGDDYGSDWEIAPFRDLSKILIALFSQTKHLDIGCGKGLLVQAMRELGNDSQGIDFSQALISQANQNLCQYLKSVTAEDWLAQAQLDLVELITFTEVFEHLPVPVLESNLHHIANVYSGKLFITIPSFGLDSTYKLGIQVSHANSQWCRDMTENIPFQNIVLEDGLPHFGHITLASYRWWSEFFLFNGYSRNRDLEVRSHQQFQSIFKKYNWNPYILEKTPNAQSLDQCLKSGLSLGKGWHSWEAEGRWTDGYAQMYIHQANFKPDHLKIVLSLPEINYIQAFDLIVTLDNLTKDDRFQFRWNQCFSAYSSSTNVRDKSVEIILNLTVTPSDMVDSQLISDCWRINLISPHFSPQDYELSEDSRRLGVFVRSIQVV